MYCIVPAIQGESIGGEITNNCTEGVLNLPPGGTFRALNIKGVSLNPNTKLTIKTKRQPLKGLTYDGHMLDAYHT